jgi:hypothetical protein
MKTVKVEHHYSHGLDEVYRAFSDPDFYIAKFEGIGDRNVKVVDHGEDDEGFWIEIDREVPADAPGMLRKFMSEWNSMGQTENWTRDNEGCRNELELFTKGVPLEITGEMFLSGDEESCVNRVVMSLKSNVPLLGGALEKFGAERTREGLDAEYEFISGYLDG